VTEPSTAREPLSIALACFSGFGGSGVVTSELAVGLARRGHRVRLLSSAAPARPLPSCDRLSFHHVPVPSYPLFEHAPYTLALASKIIELGGAEELDVLHVHYAVPHAASAMLACQALGPRAPRVLVTLHGTDVTHVGVDPSYQAITRFTVDAADAISVPSSHLEHEARTRLGVSSSIDVIGNFVDTEHFAPAPRRDRAQLAALLAQAGCAAAATGAEAPVIFHASNLRAVKRPLDLIEVLARVSARLPARLVIVGDGPERPAIEARARELGVRERVCFLGRRAEFVALLQQADVFVLPSETESFGLAALEAMSAGVPVCGYRVGGLPEVVSDDAGTLVAAYDVEALAHAVFEVLSNPVRRDALGNAARARAEALFKPEPAIARYEYVYRRVVALPKRWESR
jgi:L-malate glycosyltransferase